MNGRDEVEELARYFTLLEPKERLSFLRAWFTRLVEERGYHGRKLLRRFYSELEDIYLDSNGKLSDWMKKKLVKDMGLTPTELAEEAYRTRKLRQADIPYLKYLARRIKTGLLISKKRQSKRGSLWIEAQRSRRIRLGFYLRETKSVYSSSVLLE